MTVTIEIDGPHNECLSFRPLSRRIRGRFEYARDSEPQSKLAAADTPESIPGQRIGIAHGKGFVEEPLWYDEHAPVRESLEARGYSLPPKVEEFEIDANSWAFWMTRAVQSGVARIVAGKLPKVDEARAKKNFITTVEPSATDKLTAALERQARAMEALLEKLSS